MSDVISLQALRVLLAAGATPGAAARAAEQLSRGVPIADVYEELRAAVEAVQRAEEAS